MAGCDRIINAVSFFLAAFFIGIGLSGCLIVSGDMTPNFTTALQTTPAACNWGYLLSCLSAFLLVTPSGVKLSSQKLAEACMTLGDSGQCLAEYECESATSHEYIISFIKSYQFLNSICSPNSQFMQSVKEYEGCYKNVSQKVQSCYSRVVKPVASDDDDSKWKPECCEYKELVNCAVQATEDACGPSASQLLFDYVFATTGLALEKACLDYFPSCQKVTAAASLAYTSTTLVLASLLLIFSSRWSLWAA